MFVFLFIFLFLDMHCLFMSFAQFSDKVGFFSDDIYCICMFYIPVANIFTSFLFTYYFGDLKIFASFIFLSDVMINFFKYSS